MRITVMGVNFASAPVALRERLTYTAESRRAALLQLLTIAPEAVILDTCNRSELYVAYPAASPRPALDRFLANFHHIDLALLRSHLFAYSDGDAARHVCAVAAGARSLVVGDQQIMAQLRDAFEFAADNGTCGPVLSALFRQALRAGKRARTETHIAQGSLSVSAVAVARAQELIGPLAPLAVLLVGAGKMSLLAAQSLHAAGVTQLSVANRTPANAAVLAGQFGGRSVNLSALAGELATHDLVVTATAATGPILTADMVAAAVTRRGAPLCIIDLAMPRNVEPAVAALPGVQLVDLDGLRDIAARNLDQRRAELAPVGQIVEAEADEFERWRCALAVAPTISALHQRAEQIRQSELTDHLGSLQELTPHGRRLVERITAAIVGRLLREPTLRLKAHAQEADGPQVAATLRQLFALDESHGH
ncbi:MAG: glutamyl-tRNA reductase [Chloroflexi bacterium]|nr:glutamyl-tRNA reductase [Chloroflexota bacterium]